MQQEGADPAEIVFRGLGFIRGGYFCVGKHTFDLYKKC